MQSRALHAAVSHILFLFAAVIGGMLVEHPAEPWRIAFWSGVGIATYIAWSRVFGFDPHRTRITAYAGALVHYVDRWELRLGQATLSMLGTVVLLAGLLDKTHFVVAVVCATLSAWTYFVLRLYVGGYRSVAADRA